MFHRRFTGISRTSRVYRGFGYVNCSYWSDSGILIGLLSMREVSCSFTGVSWTFHRFHVRFTGVSQTSRDTSQVHGEVGGWPDSMPYKVCMDWCLRRHTTPYDAVRRRTTPYDAARRRTTPTTPYDACTTPYDAVRRPDEVGHQSHCARLKI